MCFTGTEQKSVNFCQQNCDFDGLGEESEQTDTPTHALTAWEEWVGGEGGWVGGRVRVCVVLLCVVVLFCVVLCCCVLLLWCVVVCCCVLLCVVVCCCVLLCVVIVLHCFSCLCYICTCICPSQYR